jgi:hypothetical protein
MSSTRNLTHSVQSIETDLDLIADPVELMAEADRIRADLAVIITKATRRAAWTAKRDGRMNELEAEQWRGRTYLLRMAKQYAEENGLPNDNVRDITTRHILDITDLARLRGSRR